MAWNIAVVAALLLALGYIGFLHLRVYRRERALTRTDGLTHVENRRAFYEDACREFERARRRGPAAARGEEHGAGYLLVRGRGTSAAQGVRAGAPAPALAPAAELRRADATPDRAVGLGGRHIATRTTRSLPPRFASYIA